MNTHHHSRIRNPFLQLSALNIIKYYIDTSTTQSTRLQSHNIQNTKRANLLNQHLKLYFKIYIFSKVWKISIVKMILKWWNPSSEPKSYQLISHISVWKASVTQTYLPHDWQNLIADHKFGFWHRLSTIYQGHRVNDEIFTAFEKKWLDKRLTWQSHIKEKRTEVLVPHSH